MAKREAQIPDMLVALYLLTQRNGGTLEIPRLSEAAGHNIQMRGVVLIDEDKIVVEVKEAPPTVDVVSR